MDRSEPCDRCGDETRVGSPRYPGRHQGTLDDGSAVFRCGECAASAIAAHEHESTVGADWFARSVPGANVRAVF